MPKTINEMMSAATVDVEWTTSVAERDAKRYIRTWFEYIWIRYLWRETLILFRIPDATPVVEEMPEGTESVGKVYDLPCEDVVVLAKPTMQLNATSFIAQVQRDPERFIREGTAWDFVPEGQGATEGTRRVRLTEPPSSVTIDLLVLGKKPVPVLGDDDAVPITGSHIALEAYAKGELLRRMRQYSRATDRFNEAQHHLDNMWDKELKQASNRKKLTPRRSVQFNDGGAIRGC